MADTHADVDRLLAGDLSAADERRLAQAALNDPDLFDELTAAAAADSALRTAEHDASRPTSRRLFALLPVGAAAAALLLTVVYVRSSSRAARPQPAAEQTQAISPPVSIAAPVLLTAMRAGLESAATFRAEEKSSRLPKENGAVVAVHDNVVDVDLGSVDGLRQGLEVQIVRGTSSHAIGRVRIVSVFRDRARGELLDGRSARVHDLVRAVPGVYVTALLEQAAARRAGRDLAGARALIELAVSKSGPEVPDEVRRRALDEHAETLNEIGATEIRQGTYTTAEQTLRAAVPIAAGSARIRVLNNLGALAALQGDRQAAESLYRQALSHAGDSADLAADRASIEQNLRSLAPR